MAGADFCSDINAGFSSASRSKMSQMVLLTSKIGQNFSNR